MASAPPDLVCYVHPGWQPRLRAAGPRRDWMEASPERFAYRCLPLAIANAHGWELLSPCAFEARWDGGQGVEAVEIRVDAGFEAAMRPVSLFGQGTITFHVEGIMRTPPGWNLLVGGPPNAAKDGLAPLSGVIETDWSPYSFTMNWRFTRPGHWVRFEEDEPFCFFFPVQRGVLEQVEPRILPIAEEPGLGDAFQAWSRSRDAFHQWVAETRPQVPADKWQKLYYRGLRPDGMPGPADHAAKLRLSDFRAARASGDGLAPNSCPAHAGMRTPAGSTMPVRPPALIAEPALALALGRIGFDPQQAADALAPATGSAPAPAPEPDLASRRRAWIAQARERQRTLAPPEIPRVAHLPGDIFLRDHYAASRPVVIEGMIEHWPARRRWTPDYLKEKVGDAPIEYQGGRDGSPDFERTKDHHKQTAPFGAFIDRIRTGGNDCYLTAYNSAANRAALAPLDADLEAVEDYLTAEPGMLWIGPEGTFTPLHFDLTNNMIVQVVGAKELLIAAPEETPNLYNSRHVFSDVHDLSDPTRLDAYPLAREARILSVTLNPGDMIYLPVGWWHQVRSLDFSVTLTFTNFRWPNDAWESFPFDAPS